MPRMSGPVRRYILTGAPGAGKTTILAALRDRGYAVVDEAATDVIADRHAAGDDEPWRDEGFVDAVAALQRERQERPAPAGTTVQVFDRSPVCTLALARYLGRPITPTLATQVERVVTQGVYQRPVFFVRLLGFITPTAARRISFAEAVRFEGFHEQAYRQHGFEVVDVPAGPVGRRVELLEGFLRSPAT